MTSKLQDDFKRHREQLLNAEPKYLKLSTPPGAIKSVAELIASDPVRELSPTSDEPTSTGSALSSNRKRTLRFDPETKARIQQLLTERKALGIK